MQMPSLFDSLKTGRLAWLPELGFGFYEVEPGQPYDSAYFEKYRAMAATPMGAAITSARLDLVRRWWTGPVVDIGIGCGTFVEAHGDARGYDVNPTALDWLHSTGRFCDPYRDAVDAITCWDSLEHIRDPGPLLAHARRWVFVSIPIFRSAEHAIASKHFRRDEHYLYFTEPGFERFMASQGFRLREADNIETLLGREDIRSFAFERVS